MVMVRRRWSNRLRKAACFDLAEPKRLIYPARSGWPWLLISTIRFGRHPPILEARLACHEAGFLHRCRRACSGTTAPAAGWAGKGVQPAIVLACARA